MGIGAGAACGGANPPCGTGQECIASKCVNTAWKQPSGEVCLSCHDDAATTAHVSLNTWYGVTPPLESCAVCHGPGSELAVDRVHDISDPYVPPYSRDP